MANYSLNYTPDYEKKIKNVIDDFLLNRKDIIDVKIGDNVVKMSRSLYNVNLLLMRAFYYFKKDVNETNLFIPDNLDKKTVNTFINDNILNKLKYDNNVEDLKIQLTKTIGDLVNLAALSNGRIGNSISLFDIIELMNENKEFLDMVDYHIDVDKPINESEIDLNKQTKRLLEIMRDSNKDIGVYVRSGVGIKPKQLRETIVSIGHKPDIFGDIMPTPINNSLIKGMSDPIEYYVAASSARKALVVNYSGVSKSGYLTRKISLFMMDNKLDKDVVDCGTNNYLKFTIQNQHMLTNLNGRYYLDDKGELSRINKDDTFLIGKEINLRSPMKCALTHKYKTCKTCYGDLSKINNRFNIGLIATLHLTSRFTQSLLSTKHMMKITTDSIEWGDVVKKYFIIKKSSIIFNNDLKNKKLEIRISDNDINSENDLNKFIHTITIVDGDDEFVVDFDNEMYNDSLIEKLESNQTPQLSISGSSLDDFKLSFKIRNQEFSRILNRILKVIDSKEIEKYTTADTIYEDFIELLEKNETNVNSVHVELILSNLIKDVSNIYHKYDFSNKENPEEYTLVRLSDAIKHKSQFMGISFERMKEQMESPDFYDNDGTSIIENLYT